MRYVIFGGGPIGGGLAARLLMADQDVWLVDHNQANIEAIRKHGLTLKLVERNQVVAEKVLPLRAVRSPESIGAADVVVLAAKSHATRSAMEGIQQVSDAHTIILSNQNGLGNVDILKEVFSSDQLAYSVVQYGGSRPAPGEIWSSASPENLHLAVTSENEALRSRLEEMAEILRSVGLNMQYFTKPELDRRLWIKLAANCALNGICALCRCPMDGVSASQAGVELTRKIVEECCAVANGLGISITPEDIVIVDRTVQPRQNSDYHHYPSMVADLVHRQPTEENVLNGAVVRKGLELGIPTPYNEAISLLVRLTEETYDVQFGA